MNSNFDVCILGSGVVGRSLALSLAMQRLKVALVGEAPISAEADIRAYALNAESKSLLDALRCWPTPEACPVLQMQVWGDGDGKIEFTSHAAKAQALAWIVDAQALLDRLAQAIAFQPLIEQFDTSHPLPTAKLTVICEGKASATRNCLGVNWQSVLCQQEALACRVRTDLPHQNTARQWFDGDRILAFLPMTPPSGTEEHHTCAVVWSAAPEQVKAWLGMPENELAKALSQASHGALGELALTSVKARWPLQNARAEQWLGSTSQANGTQTTWLLAGDAAHAVHPLAGQGLNLGLGDVACLSACIEQRAFWRSVADPFVLRPYVRERKAAALAMTRAMSGLQTLFTHTDPVVKALRNQGLNLFNQFPMVKTWLTSQAMGKHTSRS